MNTCNSINSLALGKLLKKVQPKPKEQTKDYSVSPTENRNLVGTPQASQKTRISTDSNPATATATIVEFFQDLWNNQPNVVIGVGVATAVLLGIYIFLLDITK